MQNQRATLLISGKVQGVTYRASTVEAANSLELTGYVRNLSDGRVEVVAEGAPETLADLERWCRTGPPAASVSAVEASHEPATNEFNDFQIR